jgi:hypothetical protein
MEPPKFKLDLPKTKGGAKAEGVYADWYAKNGQKLRKKYRRPKG